VSKHLPHATLPRYWLVLLVAALALIARRERDDLRQVEGVGAELGEIVGARLREQDQRDAEMLGLTRRVVALTRKVVLLTWVIAALTVVAVVLTSVIVFRG
jgi:hypothetical protein